MVCAVVVGISRDNERGHAGIRQIFVRAVVRDVIGEKERAHTVVEYVKEVTTEILEFTEDPDVLSSARESIAYRLMDELEK